MNSLCQDLTLPLVQEATCLTEMVGKKTLTACEVQTATRLVLPGDLAKYALSEGKNFSLSSSAPAYPFLPVLILKATKAVAKFSESTEKGSHRKLAGFTLQFPLHCLVHKTGKTAPINLACVIEYLCAEVLKVTGKAAKNVKTRRIVPRHIMLAVRGDEEVDVLLLNAYILPYAGVMPHIHKCLIRSAPSASLLQQTDGASPNPAEEH
ncbi:Histone H2B type 1-A [Balamuthia mandrillaris]